METSFPFVRREICIGGGGGIFGIVRGRRSGSFFEKSGIGKTGQVADKFGTAGARKFDAPFFVFGVFGVRAVVLSSERFFTSENFLDSDSFLFFERDSFEELDRVIILHKTRPPNS